MTANCPTCNTEVHDLDPGDDPTCSRCNNNRSQLLCAALQTGDVETISRLAATAPRVCGTHPDRPAINDFYGDSLCEACHDQLQASIATDW